jgi:hypothetical protein
MKRILNSFLIIFLAIPLLVLTGMFLSNSYGIYRASVSNKWPTVQGTVISSKVDTTTTYSARDRSTQDRNGRATKIKRKETVITHFYYAVITYKYQLNGV